jgi:hypothetical protein
LDEIIREVDKVTADGKVTQEEIESLKEKLAILERNNNQTQ